VRTARLDKLRRRAPFVRTQEHLDKIIQSFEPEHRSLAIEAVRDILPMKLEARDMPVEVKPKDEANPTLQEATAARLNSQAAKIIEQSETIAEMDQTIRDLQEQLNEKDKEK